MNFTEFLEEYWRLSQRFPVVPTHNTGDCENADSGDYLAYSKNAYYCFDNSTCVDNIYVFDSFKARDCVDGDYVIDSELCYEGIDITGCYNCTYCNYCARVTDSHFCWDCTDSDHLFGCVHLKFKHFCIFNQQYSQQEYEQKIQELLKKPADENLETMHKLSLRYPVSTTNVSHSENCDFGNHVHYSKNLYLCFDAVYSEDSGYLYDAHYNKGCYDLTQTFHCEFCYECVDSVRMNRCFYMTYCNDIFDSSFCYNCANSNHLFGCVGLDGKEYCLLNRQYSSDEYEQRFSEIMSSFKTGSQEGNWANFFLK
jgi:hypothetical protein